MLTMYDGTVKVSLGKCNLQVNNWQEECQLVFEVLETKHCSLLSLDSCLDLQVCSYKEESVCLAEARQKEVFS